MQVVSLSSAVKPAFGRLVQKSDMERCRLEATRFEEITAEDTPAEFHPLKPKLESDLTFVEKHRPLSWWLLGGFIIAPILWLKDKLQGKTLEQGLINHGFVHGHHPPHVKPQHVVNIFFTKDFGDMPLDRFREQANRWIYNQYEAIKKTAGPVAQPVALAAIRYFDNNHLPSAKRNSILPLEKWNNHPVNAMIREYAWLSQNRVSLLCQLKKN